MASLIDEPDDRTKELIVSGVSLLQELHEFLVGMSDSPDVTRRRRASELSGKICDWMEADERIQR